MTKMVRKVLGGAALPVDDPVDLINLNDEICKHKERVSRLTNVEASRIDSELRESKQCLQKLRKELNDFEASDAKQREHIGKLESELHEMIKELEHEVPYKETIRKLYTLVSKIHWDSKAGPGEFKGHIVGKRVIPFNFVKADHPDYYITNQLWNLISKSNE